MQKLTTALYLLYFFLLAVIGVWLLIEPTTALNTVHGGPVSGASDLMARQAASGLLLAAGVNLFCALRGDVRQSLHMLILVYLIAMVASHGPVAFAAAAWLWLPVALYALPLLLPLLKKVPVPAPSAGKSGELEGEVKWFNPNKGFGFLITAGGDEYFVHFRAVQNGGRRSLRQGQKVRFVLRESERGLQADQVVIQR